MSFYVCASGPEYLLTKSSSRVKRSCIRIGRLTLGHSHHWDAKLDSPQTISLFEILEETRLFRPGVFAFLQAVVLEKVLALLENMFPGANGILATLLWRDSAPGCPEEKWHSNGTIRSDWHSLLDVITAVI